MRLTRNYHCVKMTCSMCWRVTRLQVPSLAGPDRFFPILQFVGGVTANQHYIKHVEC